MSRGTWYNDQKYTTQGAVEGDFSFVTNNTSDPDPTLFRGCGGLTGSQVGNGLPNASKSFVASIVRVGQATGSFLVTLVDGWRYVTSWDANIQDAADNLVPRLSAFTNEGQGHTTPVSFTVVVRNMSTSAATDTTGRRIAVQLVLKDSGNGS